MDTVRTQSGSPPAFGMLLRRYTDQPAPLVADAIRRARAHNYRLGLAEALRVQQAIAGLRHP